LGKEFGARAYMASMLLPPLPEVIDSENTPAQGLAALRRRRRGPFAQRHPPTFVDFAIGLSHPEVVEDLHVVAAGTRMLTRVRVRHAVPQASAGTVFAWSPGELSGAPVMSGEVTGIHASEDGSTLVLWSTDKGYFNVIQPATLKSLTIGWRTPRVGRWGVRFDPRACALSPDGRAVAVLGERGQLAVYAPLDAVGPDLTHAEGVRGVAWSPEGERLAIVEGNDVSVVDVETGDRAWRVARPRPQSRACHIAWDPTGRMLLVADAETEIPDGPRHDGRGAFVPRESPKGAPELRWAEDGSPAAQLPYETPVTQLGWSDDGKRLLLVARPGGLLVWNVEKHEPLVHEPTVATAAFGPRGAWVAYADEASREVVIRWV
jgi:WD40 repeat protein